MSAVRQWGIVGGGMLGLTLAHRLAGCGHRVTVFDAAPVPGGLASAWRLGDVVWDRHYHVTLDSDTALRSLLNELGLASDLTWVPTRNACYSGGTLYPLSTAREFARFPLLGLIDKARLAATILHGSYVRRWQRLEGIGLEQWLTAWSGRRTFDRFWRPLLRAKLGEGYRDASASFVWAVIQRLYAARRSGHRREMFGYVPGGYARILDRFVEALRAEHVELRMAASVARVERRGSRVCVTEHDGTSRDFDEVVITANTAVAARLVAGLADAERLALEAIRYQGVVCASLLLKQPLSPYYLTCITDDVPFTAVVEMSALVDRRQFGGQSLVYLPKYCGAEDPLMRASDAEIEDTFVGALARMHPGFSRADVVCFRVSRVPQVFAMPTLGYSTRVPRFSTSVPGVHLVTSAQIVNGTLNVNETVGLAERAVDHLLGGPRPEHAAAVTRHAALEARGAARRPVATLSLDLDNLWSYLKIRGDQSWRTCPSFLDRVVPRALDVLDRRRQPITWFVVGRDAAIAEHGPLLASIAAAGHEIGNHSFWHEPWLHRYSPERLDHELQLAEEALEQATGRRPRGFRGPGFSLSAGVLQALARRGYAYDASTLPTFIGPFARAFYFGTATLTAEEMEERADAFGPLREGTRPLRPYRWHVAGSRLVEVPVTTMPLVRTPVHMSYLVYLGERSHRLARTYLACALRLCRTLGIAPSLLLHSHDFVGVDEVPAMSFFPGFRMTGASKRRLVAECIDRLRGEFDVLPLGEFVNRLDGLPLVEPRFFHRRAHPDASAGCDVQGAVEGTYDVD